MAVTFNPPIPGPNVSHLDTIVVTGTVDGNGPNCQVVGIIQSHNVPASFAVGIDGAFMVNIAAGLLMDNNRYELTVSSADPVSAGSIFLDTRPAG